MLGEVYCILNIWENNCDHIEACGVSHRHGWSVNAADLGRWRGKPKRNFFWICIDHQKRSSFLESCLEICYCCCFLVYQARKRVFLGFLKQLSVVNYDSQRRSDFRISWFHSSLVFSFQHWVHFLTEGFTFQWDTTIYHDGVEIQRGYENIICRNYLFADGIRSASMYWLLEGGGITKERELFLWWYDCSSRRSNRINCVFLLRF